MEIPITSHSKKRYNQCHRLGRLWQMSFGTIKMCLLWIPSTIVTVQLLSVSAVHLMRYDRQLLQKVWVALPRHNFAW